MTGDLWSGWAELMLHVTVKWSLLLGLALLLIASVRSLSAGLRHTILASALAAGLAIPVLWALAPGWGPQLGLGAADAAGGPAFASAAGVEGADASVPAGGGGGSGGERPEPAARPPGALRQEEPFLLWSLGALALACRGWRARRARGRLERTARPVTDSTLQDTLRSCAGRLGVRRPVRLLESTFAPGPVTWGARHPRIVLPAGARSWPRARQRIVLLHELAHVRRRDAGTRLLADLAVTVLWFDPLVWLAARRLSEEAEKACDDLVLAQGFRPSRYLRELVGLARGMRPGGGTQAVLGMAGRGSFMRRAAAIADVHRPRRAPTPAVRRTAWCAAAGLAFLVAGAGKAGPPPRAAVPRDASAAFHALWRSDERGAYLERLLEERGSAALPVVLALAPEVGNDAVAERLLLGMLEEGLEPAHLGPFVTAARSLEADAARERVLLRLLAGTGLPEPVLLDVIRAADDMSSEAARAEVLRSAAGTGPLSDRAAAELRRAAGRLERPSGRRAVLGALSN